MLFTCQDSNCIALKKLLLSVSSKRYLISEIEISLESASGFLGHRLGVCMEDSQSAEHGNCTHKKIHSRSTCTPKIRPCTRVLYAYRVNIGT